MHVKTFSSPPLPYLERFGNTDTLIPGGGIICGNGTTTYAPHLGQIYDMFAFVAYYEKKLVAHSGEAANFGTFTNFNLSTAPDIEKVQRIHIFPNVVSDKLIVTYETKLSGPVQLTLCNSAGVIVSRYTSTNRGVDQTAEMNVAHLPAGIYFLTLNSSEGTWQEKVIVRR